MTEKQYQPSAEQVWQEKLYADMGLTEEEYDGFKTSWAGCQTTRK